MRILEFGPVMARDVSERLFTTVSGVPIERLYTPETHRGFRTTIRISAIPASRPTRAAFTQHVSRQALDDAAVQRIRHRVKKRTHASSYLLEARPDRTVRRLSPADVDGLRLRSSDVRRRSRQVRRRDRFAGRHGSALRRHSARQDQHVHDDQCSGDDPLVHVSCRRRKAGRDLERARGTIQNDILKEYIAQKT